MIKVMLEVAPPPRRPKRPPRPSNEPTGAPIQESAAAVPPRPPPPKIFGAEDDPAKTVDLPEAPMDAPEIKLPERNPKLYSLMSMGTDSSFWWDSVDDDAAPTFTEKDALAYRFDAAVRTGNDGDYEGASERDWECARVFRFIFR